MIRLINGDCYEELPKLEGNVDLIVTDPPYQFGSVRGSGIFSEKNFERYGRSRSIDNLKKLEKLKSVTFKPEVLLDMLDRICKPFNGYFFCNKELVADYIIWARNKGYTYDILYMTKQNPVPAHSTHHVVDTEYIVFIRGKGTHFNGSGFPLDFYRKSFTVVNKGKKLHPAEKPYELIERFVLLSSAEGMTVIDPFMGCGTTGIVSKRNGRNFIGIELDKDYFSLSEWRIGE